MGEGADYPFQERVEKAFVRDWSVIWNKGSDGFRSGMRRLSLREDYLKIFVFSRTKTHYHKAYFKEKVFVCLE